MAIVLKIPYTLSNGKTWTITAKDPKSSLTDSDIDSFSNYIITNSIFQPSSNTVVSRNGDAYYYRTDTNILPES